MYELVVEQHFEAAHYLRGYQGKCENLHGHRYSVVVRLQSGRLNEIGLAYDFTDIKKDLKEIMARFDHVCLNDVSPFDRINPSAENIFGISAKIGQGMSFIEAVRDYELEKPVRQCLKTKKPQQEYLDLRNRGLYLGMIVTPLATEPGCLVLVQDLSRLKKLEIIRKDFIANVSHELRTPVSSIKLLSETLENGALEDPAVSLKFLKQINQEAGKLEGIVQGMTTLAQIESGEGRLKKKPVDICKLAGQAAERLREMADRNGQELEVILPGNEVMVMADASQLEQVIYNITHNAIKFTPHGGKVKIQVTCDGLQVVVSISDTGCGIDPSDLERIFERFYKVDKSRNSRGSGLGLAISRHIIEAHGGHIWAESDPNMGSRVSFSLPC